MHSAAHLWCFLLLLSDVALVSSNATHGIAKIYQRLLSRFGVLNETACNSLRAASLLSASAPSRRGHLSSCMAVRAVARRVMCDQRRMWEGEGPTVALRSILRRVIERHPFLAHPRAVVVDVGHLRTTVYVPPCLFPVVVVCCYC